MVGKKQIDTEPQDSGPASRWLARPSVHYHRPQTQWTALTRPFLNHTVLRAGLKSAWIWAICLPFPTRRLASRHNGTLNHKFTLLAGKTPFPSSESWWPGNRSKYFNICSSSLERLKPVLLPVHQEEASLGGFKDPSPGSRSSEPLLS